jgi:hypothetical protein
MKTHDQDNGISKKIRHYFLCKNNFQETEAKTCTSEEGSIETLTGNALNFNLDESQSDDGDEFKTQLVSIEPNLLRPSLIKIHERDTN